MCLEFDFAPVTQKQLWKRSPRGAYGQNARYHIEVGAPPILVYFSGDWDVHWGLTEVLTHGHMVCRVPHRPRGSMQAWTRLRRPAPVASWAPA